MKAAKCMGTTQKVCTAFEEQTMQVKPTSASHSYPSFKKDLAKMVDVLWEEDVFTTLRSREHKGFEKMKSGILQKHSKKFYSRRFKKLSIESTVFNNHNHYNHNHYNHNHYNHMIPNIDHNTYILSQ